MNFGEKLQQLRKERNLSQEQFAEIIGVSRQTISRWEASQTAPDLVSLEKICQYFNMTYDELLVNKKEIHKDKLSVIFILISVFLFIISFFLPNSKHDLTTSAIIITPAGFCLFVSLIGFLFSILYLYKNHR